MSALSTMTTLHATASATVEGERASSHREGEMTDPAEAWLNKKPPENKKCSECSGNQIIGTTMAISESGCQWLAPCAKDSQETTSKFISLNDNAKTSYPIEDAEQPDLVPTNTEESEEGNNEAGANTSKKLFNAPINRLHGLHDLRHKKGKTAREVLAAEGYAHEEPKQGLGEASAYLLRYESMVAQQEAEEVATLSYILPLLEILHELGKYPEGRDEAMRNSKHLDSMTNKADNDKAFCRDLAKRSITCGELKQALDILEIKSTTDGSTEIITQDRQLIMILRILMEKQKQYSPSSSSFKTVDDSSDNVSITWAEIIHCYRVCIIGMLTLTNLPKGSGVRSRAKDRILAQLSLFRLPETKLFAGDMIVGSDTPNVASLSQKQGELVVPEQTKKTYRTSESKPNRNVHAVLGAALVATALGFILGYFLGASAIHDPTRIRILSLSRDQMETRMNPKDAQYTSRKEKQETAAHCSVESSPLKYLILRANNTASISSSSSPGHTPARGSLPMTTSLRATTTSTRSTSSPSQNSMLTSAMLTRVVSKSNIISTPVNTSAKSKQSAVYLVGSSPEQGHEPKRSKIRKAVVARHFQLAVSAFFGGKVSSLVPSGIAMIGKSLGVGGCIGIAPPGLVVAGAVALAVYVGKGVWYFLSPPFRRARDW